MPYVFNPFTGTFDYTEPALQDGDKGDLTVSGNGATWTIDNDVVTYAKIQNVSGTDKVLGRQSVGAGVVEEISCTAAGRALIDDADASAQRTTLGLGTLATQSGTFSGTSSGTNTGDQNLFSTIAVAGQSNVVADTTSDTLTLVAGTNIGITTNATTDTVTISSTLIESGTPESGNIPFFTNTNTLTWNTSFYYDGYDLYVTDPVFQSSIGHEGIYYANDVGTYFAVNTTGVYIGDGYPNPMDLIVSSYLTGFPDALTVKAGFSRVGIRNSNPNQPLDVVGTVRIGYDTTNHLEISSSSTGLITYNATGTGSAHYFADAIRATNHINFDATIGDSGYGFRSSSGVMQFKNSGGSWQSIEKGSEALTANFTTSNTTATNTNLSFPIAANEKYKVRVTGTASKATSATGLKLAIAAPTGCTIKGVQYGGGATLAASLVPSLITAINTLGTTFATGIGIEVPFVLEFVVTNSSTAGNITLQAATVTSNTLTIYAGTSLQYEPYTGV